MLFRPEHIEPILSGRKKQTRRRWKRPMVKVGGKYWAQTKLFKNDSRFARIRVTGLEREFLGFISEEDAQAEGYENIDAFLDAFIRINKLKREHTLMRVWKVTFEVLP